MISTLRGKVALITGAASGIGKHLATRFVEAGTRVAVADVSAEAANAACAELTGKGGLALPVKMDVTVEQEVKDGVQEILSCYGTIDILISNAGIQFISPIVDLSFEQWQNVLAVHLNGTFLTVRAVMRHLFEIKRGGSIIAIGSIHSHFAAPMKSPYITAKHGLAGFTKAIAKEGGAHDIRSYLICPAFVDTPLVRKQIPEQAQRLQISQDEVINKIILGNTVDGQFTTVEDLADLALFLAAYPTMALTGQSFIASHGSYMQ